MARPSRRSSSFRSSEPGPISSSPTSLLSWPKRSVGEAESDLTGGDLFTNEEWFARAQRVIPGGVDSPVRSFASVGGTPYTVQRGEGPWVYDVEGRRYLDFVQSYGAVLLGHAHHVVLDALAAAAGNGTTFGAPTTGEVLLAEAIVERVAGCDQVRFVSS